jgi:hypothetical protein
MGLEIIGAGFGRTGTTSLRGALEQLGYGRCYHWHTLTTRSHQVRIWQKIIDGQKPDWDRVFAGYNATVDWPGCTYYQQLAEAYPQAKVILTVRDPDSWYASATSTIYRARKTAWARSLSLAPQRLRAYVTLLDTLVWDGTFNGRFEDKQYALEVFNRHNEEVQATIDPERLLVYNVKEGWEPLCRFLGVPVPETPFPRLNDRRSFKSVIHRWELAGVGVVGLALGVAAAGAARILRSR